MARVARGYLTQPQVQQAVGVSRRTLRAMADEGLLPARNLSPEHVVLAKLVMQLGFEAIAHAEPAKRRYLLERVKAAATTVGDALSAGRVRPTTRVLVSPPGPGCRIHLVDTRQAHREVYRHDDDDYLDMRVGAWLGELRTESLAEAA